MPELPEVESTRRSLLTALVGRRVERVVVRRPDVIHPPPPHRRNGDTLLGGLHITDINRHGKQLAIRGASDSSSGRSVPTDQQPTICVHLGMTGSLVHTPAGQRRRNGAPARMNHVHIEWRLCSGGRLVFRDPRRFGGVWAFKSFDSLRQARWSKLGPDALGIRPRQLHARLQCTKRALKAVLLDQAVIAGLGNIYVDELLFACGLHPLTPGHTLALSAVQRLVRQMRSLLRRAIGAGGSTFRDYVDGQGNSGGFQHKHLVYSRAGQPCPRCGQLLVALLVAGRSTVACPECQGDWSPLCKR